MIKGIIFHVIVAILIIYHWNSSDHSSKDEFFYIYFAGSQVSIFIFLNKISKLTDELMNLKKEPKE